MPRKALLIGSQTNGLSGVEHDVAAIAEALGKRDFTITRCVGPDATRAGIHDAYEHLIAQAGPDDSVFVYYSGHGGRSLPTRAAQGRPPVQFIVPTDLDESVEGDFRGITAVELSMLLGRLTEKTHNVAVMLDCCHSAHMSRDPDHRVKALHYPFEWLDDHVTGQLGSGSRRDLWRPLGNDNAVRMVACAPEQSAFEYTTATGVRMGMFTEAFTKALAEAGDLPVTWAALMDRVRRSVLALAPEQRPEAEGPSSRLLFDVMVEDAVGALRVVGGANPQRVTLEVAPLLGVQVSDEFAIMPPGAEAVDQASAVGTAVVDRLSTMAAHARATLHDGWTEIPVGARAFRIRTMAPKVPISLPVDDPRAADLLSRLGPTALLRPAEPDEAAIAAVTIDADGGMTVRDRVGPLHPPRPAGVSQATLIRADLVRLARAALLRELRDDPRRKLEDPVTVEWGRVIDGTEQPLPAFGDVLHTGERVFVRIRNDGGRPLYASLVDIGIGGRITLLTRFSPAGVRLGPGQQYVFGSDEVLGTLDGVALEWPAGVDRADARPESLLVLVADAPQDLGVLEQDGVHARRGTADESALEQLVRQISVGGVRDFAPAGGPPVRYTVRFLDFDVTPVPAPRSEEVVFEIDDRPERSVRLFTPRGAAPRRVAVRLGELVVHRNRALLGADIRVDAVVTTGGAPPEAARTTTPVYTAQTARFSNVRDDHRLPLDNLLVYLGPATDFLDIAVFVSRDTKDSLALSDLMRQELVDQEVQAAGAQLAGLFLAAPQAAIAVAAVGAGAVVVNVAYKLLLGAVGKSIGLYRTSLLAHEGFGVGRHPADGSLRRAQDFSFSFTVEAVD
ncbi:caspase family protein [Dactylosporangium roseum]|uniref:Caspase family protein n=1 Tax=Dactylosporangium roseum TaxID=47989 RepID=A0ABY5Z4W5_9ACTN|nr:caspase family protein [Dactylosporangium roseum]UWZ37090.1 caspase family protein [Dactylosporangium roseum]